VIVAFLIYVGLSLLLGGSAAMIDIWSPPTMLDRADGRGKFASPKMHDVEIVMFAVFVALIWPILEIASLSHRIAARKKG